MRVPIFHLEKRVQPLFFSPFSSPFALYIFPDVLFWEKSATIAFFSKLPSLCPLYFSRRFILGKECDHCFFSTLPSLPPLYFSRLFILGKECNHYFLLFSPLHSASLCFTSFVFCGVNFRHFLTTLLTNNDKEPVKKPKKFFQGLSFYLLQNYLLYIQIERRKCLHFITRDRRNQSYREELLKVELPEAINLHPRAPPQSSLSLIEWLRSNY